MKPWLTLAYQAALRKANAAPPKKAKAKKAVAKKAAAKKAPRGKPAAGD